MDFRVSLTLAAVVAASFVAPATAQVAPPDAGGLSGSAQAEHASGPSIPHWGYVPTAADVKKANAVENPAVRNVAESVFAQLASGNLNRAKLTQDVNAAFSDSTEKLLSQRLSQLGSPAWKFVRNEQTQAGAVSIYQLQFETSSVYMTLGVADNGVVYALELSRESPA
jgi:hypothetical protein